MRNERGSAAEYIFVYVWDPKFNFWHLKIKKKIKGD